MLSFTYVSNYIGITHVHNCLQDRGLKFSNFCESFTQPTGKMQRFFLKIEKANGQGGSGSVVMLETI